MFVLRKEEMSELDKSTMREFSMSSEHLMEIAGKSSVDKIIEICQKQFINPQFLILCGIGNNGGDGFVIARWLNQNSYSCVILLLGDPNKMSQETHKNYSRCQKLNIPIHWIQSDKYIQDIQMNFDVLIDAVFGIGFNGEMDNFFRKVFTIIQERSKLCISIDIPSGIDSNTGNGIQEAIKADYTLTMSSPKLGHFFNRGKDYTGKLIIIDIGIPIYLYDKIKPSINLIDENNVCFPIRYASAHKGDYGKIAIIAGSSGLTGSAILASQACARAGGGLITLFHPASLSNVFECQLVEVMKKVIPEVQGLPDSESLITLLAGYDAILIGPGIGKSDYSKKLLKIVLTGLSKPLVIDADAINILSENRELIDFIKEKPILITPHLGEFSRFTLVDSETLKNDTIEYLFKWTNELNIPILLKSSTSICSFKNLKYLINRGNDGLATGGSGDVLSGIIISFFAQNLKNKQKRYQETLSNEILQELLVESAFSASWLMGYTAEKLSLKRKTPSIIPSDIIANLFVID